MEREEILAVYKAGSEAVINLIEQLESSQPYNVVNYIMYVLHNQLEGIENEEIHRDAY